MQDHLSDSPLPNHYSIFFLVMRRLRAPLIVLIIIMAVSVFGLTLIPGVDQDGNPDYLSLFHAFYFISYTATTIGFGELPHTFSNEQRLWVMFCIYLSVIGWAYMLGSLFSLMGDRHLQQAVHLHRFILAVRRLKEPFYLVCGYGETGRLVCRGLDMLGHRTIVIDKNADRISLLLMNTDAGDVPALTADVMNPETLQFAGLTKRECLGVLALTDNDQANLAVAITARLLAPSLLAFCRAETRETAANMASFSTGHIINPFWTFGGYLNLALTAPGAWRLITWLTGQAGKTVESCRTPSLGEWIICGHGRFGREVSDALKAEGISITIIDREPSSGISIRWIQGEATGEEALTQAGVQTAAGILAGTRDDVENLSIAVTARQLNPDIFIVVRQNAYSNQALFNAFKSDMMVVPSEIVAKECLTILSTPLLPLFLEEIRKQDDEWNMRILDRMTKRFAQQAPLVWSECINMKHAPALYRRVMNGEKITLGTVLSSPANRYEALQCEVLYLVRDRGEPILVPASDTALKPGDRLLLAGRPSARDELDLTLTNANALNYVQTGEDLPGGLVWEYFSRRRKAARTKAG